MGVCQCCAGRVGTGEINAACITPRAMREYCDETSSDEEDDGGRPKVSKPHTMAWMDGWTTPLAATCLRLGSVCTERKPCCRKES